MFVSGLAFLKKIRLIASEENQACIIVPKRVSLVKVTKRGFPLKASPQVKKSMDSRIKYSLCNQAITVCVTTSLLHLCDFKGTRQCLSLFLSTRTCAPLGGLSIIANSQSITNIWCNNYQPPLPNDNNNKSTLTSILLIPSTEILLVYF